jgi:hypothetical protein
LVEHANSIEIHCSENTDSKFAGQIRLWTDEIVGSLAGEAAPKLLSIRIYRLIDELRLFFRQEKEALGVVSEPRQNSSLLTNHEACCCVEMSCPKSIIAN